MTSPAASTQATRTGDQGSSGRKLRCCSRTSSGSCGSIDCVCGASPAPSTSSRSRQQHRTYDVWQSSSGPVDHPIAAFLRLLELQMTD